MPVTIEAPNMGKALRGIAVASRRYMIDVHKNVQKVMPKIGHLLKDAAEDKIVNGPPRSGRVVIRDGVPHLRSAFGEPAKDDTGNLADALHVFMSTRKDTVSIGYLEALAPYGASLEDASKLNRQVLPKVLEEQWGAIEAMLRHVITKTPFRKI